MNKKCSLFQLLIALISSILIAVIAELKVIYVFLVFIVLLAVILNKTSLKSLTIVLGIVGILILGYNVLEKVDPDTAKILNIESLMYYAGNKDHGYSSKNDISRVRAFDQINELFFKKNIINKTWGYGLGNCDISTTINIFNSKFAQEYDDVLHYTWFSHAILYLETGMLEYIIYISVFVYIIIYCFKNRKKDIENYYFYNAIIILSILSIIMTFYNAVLRSDMAYYVYIYLILPFVLLDKKMKKENKITNSIML